VSQHQRGAVEAVPLHDVAAADTAGLCPARTENSPYYPG
jgi:hypothetical protein